MSLIWSGEKKIFYSVQTTSSTYLDLQVSGGDWAREGEQESEKGISNKCAPAHKWRETRENI